MSARRRTALTLASVALVIPVMAGCEALDTALDCVETAESIASSVDELSRAASNAVENPTEAREALNAIDKELDKLGDKTDNADLSKAVDKLKSAMEGVGTSLEKNGDLTIDLKPVTDAAKEIGKVCTP
ncbi:hypothetical protein ACFVIM_31745 [Streptomyces sp. NPDC057638]|uniref:hypothetical protein n=1 Tax=Streptomyces sp. NPDC057638 TaxID=3346190 RepID=UPI0036C99C3B